MKQIYLAAALYLFLIACGALQPVPRYTSRPGREVIEELEKRQRADQRRLRATVDRYLGVPYKWGGTTRQGMDCSALTRAIFRETYGIELPRTSEEMYNLGRQIDDQDDLRPGDLVFFRDTYSGPGISHVGVYLGNRRFVHASVSQGGAIASLDAPYFHQRYAGARRITR